MEEKGAAEEANREGAAKGIKHDIFEDPAISRALAEDPILRWLFAHLREFAVTLAAVFAAWFVWNRFQETYYSSLSDAGQEYSRVSSSFEAYQAQLNKEAEGPDKEAQNAKAPEAEKKPVEEKDNAEKLKEQKRKLGEALLALGDAKSPYNQLASIYSGLLAARDGSTSRAKETLTADNWDKIPSAKPADRFIAEVKTLVLAKVLIDDDKEFAHAKDLLRGLAKGAHYVNVMAAVTLAKVASTPAERQEAAELLERISANQPEQAEVVQEEIARLKA